MLLFYKIGIGIWIRPGVYRQGVCVCAMYACVSNVRCEGVGVEMKLVLVLTCLSASAGRGASNGVSYLV